MSSRRWTFLLALAALFVGCGEADSPYAGEWTGTWVAEGNPTDAGTAEWSIDERGNVDGIDTDPGRKTTFRVKGTITKRGTVITTSVPADGSPTAQLGGYLLPAAGGGISGVLIWGVEPPLNYRYAFTRK